MILSFKQCFVPAVVAGTKPHTIRAGKRWREGMSIQFYQDARQKTMLKFRSDAVATSVQQICFAFRGVVDPLAEPPATRTIVLIGEGRSQRLLTDQEVEELARRDGFENSRELEQFVSQLHGLPFIGQLIHWTDLRY